MKGIAAILTLFVFLYQVVAASKAADLRVQFRDREYREQTPPPTIIVPPQIIAPAEPRCHHERQLDHDEVLGDNWTENEVCND